MPVPVCVRVQAMGISRYVFFSIYDCDKHPEVCPRGPAGTLHAHWHNHAFESTAQRARRCRRAPMQCECVQAHSPAAAVAAPAPARLHAEAPWEKPAEAQ